MVSASLDKIYNFYPFRMALPRQNYQKFLLLGRCNAKLNYLKLIAINHTIWPLLLIINKCRNLKVIISDRLFFVF